MSHYEKLKAMKTGFSDDFRTAIYAQSISSKDYERYISGEPPLILSDSVGKPLVNWSITGNTVQDGTPTPTEPIEVKGTGDKTENLWSVSSFTGSSAGFRDFFNQKSEEFSFKENEQYTISFNHAVVSATGSTGVYKLCFTYTDGTQSKSAWFTPAINPIPFTSQNGKTVSSMKITDYNNYVNVEVTNIQLELGDTATEYEPYGYKITEVTRGKNLINATAYESAYAYDDKTILNTVNSLPIGTYSVSIKFKLTSRRDISDESRYGVITIPAVISNKPTWGTSDVGEERKFTARLTISPNNVGKFEHFYVYGCGNDKVGATGRAELSEFQIELGDTATEYEPYIEPKTSEIYLNSSLMDGEVLDSEGKREVEWKELVLTGDENFIFVVGNAPFAIYPEGFKRPTNLNITTWFCSHYQSVPNSASWATYNNLISWSTAYPDYLVMRDIRFSDITSFKDFLKSEYEKGTPVTVYYQLAEPTSETVDVPAIPTIKGNCTISVDTEAKATNMSVTYKSRR